VENQATSNVQRKGAGNGKEEEIKRHEAMEISDN
jgi:hypothetical protein